MASGKRKDSKEDGENKTVLTAITPEELQRLRDEVQQLNSQVTSMAPMAARYQRISKIQGRLLNMLDEEQATAEELFMALGGLTGNLFFQLHTISHRRLSQTSTEDSGKEEAKPPPDGGSDGEDKEG